MPCLSAMAAAVAGVASGAKADPAIMDAAGKDTFATLERVMSTQCGALRCEETVRTRSVNVLSSGGWARVAYPYAPGKVTRMSAVALLCGKPQGKKGRSNATETARLRIAMGAALLGSYGKTEAFLSGECGLAAGRETYRRIATESGRRTRAAIAKGRPTAVRRTHVWKPPRGAVRTEKTRIVLVDGKAFPCVKKDLCDRRGCNGGAARKRNSNLVVVATSEWADRHGRPLFAPGAVRYHLTGAGGAALADEVWHVCGQEGVREKEGRIQFLTDGEEELEHVHQMLFEGWPNVTRALDAMHACEYGDTLCEQPAADEHAAAKASRHLRRTLVDKGWTGFEKAFRRRVPRNPPKSLSGDPAKAWTYLTKRSHQMAYPACRRQGLPIGSGMVESGCKNIFGARLESPGMRRRFANGLGPASIRVQIKSGLAISP